MYTLIQTHVLSTKTGAQWETVAGSNLIVSSLFSSYRRILLELLETETNTPMIVDMEQLKADYAFYTNTLSVLLQSIGALGLDTIPNLPNKKVGYVQYTNAHYAGYHLSFAKAGFQLESTADASMKPDVLLNRSDIADMKVLHDYCLFSVNGYIHNSEHVNGETFAKDAGKSMRLSKDNQMGIMSFMGLSKLEKKPFTSGMLSIPAGFETLKDRVAITVPETHQHKTCLLVLGGYLVFPQPGTFFKVSDLVYHVDLKKLSYIDRLLESQIYLDLSELGLSYAEVNYKNLNIEEAWRDATVIKYFGMSQSFLVFLDVDNLFFDRVHLRQFHTPGVFTAYQEPVYPLFIGTGRLADYWKTNEGDRWSVTMVDSYRRLWTHHRENESQLENIFDQLSFDVPYHFSQGYLMEIGTYKNQTGV